MYSRKEILGILEMAVLAGRILLENGAETYRVEQTINRLCIACGLDTVDNFTIPTGIFVSASSGDNLVTKVVTVRSRDIDLEIITLINDFARAFEANPTPVEEAVERLGLIAGTAHYPVGVQIFFGAIAASFFALMFGANGLEFALSFITAVVVMLVYGRLSRAKVSAFILHVLCGSANMLTALILTYLAALAGQAPRADMLAIGAMMPLVPGVAITNAVREIISGDYMSGMSRLLEAMVIAIGIAVGVGIVLNFYYSGRTVIL